MARLGGISSEALSSPSAGLASILRDHKGVLGASNGRANVVLGLVEALGAQSVFIASSPKSSLCEADIRADDPDELKEEDVWDAESRSLQLDPSRSLQIQHGYHKGFPSMGPRIIEMNSKGTAENVCVVLDVAVGGKAKQKENGAMAEVVFGLAEQKASGGGVWRSSSSRRERVHALRNAQLQESVSTTSQDKSCSRRSTASRMIPQLGGGMGKHSSKRHAENQSAPVQVPDWSKITAKQKGKAMVVMDDHEEGDDDDDRLPPHELLAREFASSQMTTFSVCEGQGRTLKGRDLSRVRDAVWSQMGFAD